MSVSGAVVTMYDCALQRLVENGYTPQPFDIDFFETKR
jgi:tartrate dehydratase beta subunit/fumarate hydratase class I family protein